MAIVGRQFPSIDVDAMNEMGDTFKLNVLEEAKNKNKKVLLFWYPKDFTFVCPTELEDMAKIHEELLSLGVEVYSVSTDSHFVHNSQLIHRLSDMLCRLFLFLYNRRHNSGGEKETVKTPIVK